MILYTAMNLPIAVWMMRSFLAEIPIAILEAATIDGAGCLMTFRKIIIPMSAPGIAATVADLLHLQLERDAVRPGAHRRTVTRRPRCSSPAS